MLEGMGVVGGGWGMGEGCVCDEGLGFERVVFGCLVSL